MLLYLLAVAIDEPIAAEPPATPPHVYLHPPPDGCDSRAHDDEVVVCASKDLDKRYRLSAPDPTQYQDKPVRAEARIGNSTVALRADPEKSGMPRMMSISRLAIAI